MKLHKIQIEDKDPIEGLYVVGEISADDITPPSEHFLKAIRQLSGFSFLNALTIDEFTKQVRQRFTSVDP